MPFPRSSILPRLSAVLVTILGCASLGQPVDCGVSARAFAAERGDALDRQVLGILQAKCVMCHDNQKASAGGGVNNLLKLEELASGYGISEQTKQPEQSELYRLISGDTPRMPKRRMNDIDGNGPLSKDDQATILQWLTRGGPSDAYQHSQDANARPLISEAERLARIARDLAALDKDQRKQARYLTLTNWHNHRSVSNDELGEGKRKGNGDRSNTVRHGE